MFRTSRKLNKSLVAGITIVFLLIGFSLFALQEKSSFKLELPLGLDEYAIDIPPDNPLTAEKVELGKLLFFDKRLSADGIVSCASCHDPKLAFTDGQSVSRGIKGRKGQRNTPTLINQLFSSEQFWDGRASSLEEQAKGPLINPVEMGNTSYDDVVNRLRRIKGYRERFKKAFGSDDCSIDRVAQAIASFERTIVSGNSPFDKFEAGGDESALSAQAKRGLYVFRVKAQCSACHGGFNFTDMVLHNIGVGWENEEKDRDLGQYHVTKKEEDKGKFKTPTLREIASTAPYMHDGRFKTLEEVIEFYDKGGAKNPYLSLEMQPLQLTGPDKKDLIAFLNALSGEGWRIKPPDKFPE